VITHVTLSLFTKERNLKFLPYIFWLFKIKLHYLKLCILFRLRGRAVHPLLYKVLLLPFLMRMTPLISPEQGQPETCCLSRQANNLAPLQSLFKRFQPRTGLVIVLRAMSKWIMAMEVLLNIKNTFIHHITATLYNTKQNSLCFPTITLNRNDILHNLRGKKPSLRFQVGKDGRVFQYNRQE